MSTTKKTFLLLSQEDRLSHVLLLQEKRKALKELSRKRSRGVTAANKEKKKKEKAFVFKDPACQDLFNMLPEEFKRTLLKA